MKNKKVLILGAIFVFIILGIIGYLRFFQSDYTPESISSADYQEAKEKIEKIIVESDYYNQVGGHDLKYVSKASDAGKLLCLDCDGFTHQFLTKNNKKVTVVSDFDGLGTGIITVSRVDAYHPDEKDISYNLMTNQEDPLNQPVGPEQEQQLLPR